MTGNVGTQSPRTTRHDELFRLLSIPTQPREVRDAWMAFMEEVGAERRALRDVLGVIEVASKELVERNDKDFFWRDRVADFVTVAKSKHRKYRGLVDA